MSDIVSFQKARLEKATHRGFRNWRSQLGEDFGKETCFRDVSMKTIALLAEGRDPSTFFLYDLIMNLEDLGSGFEFNVLNPKEKMKITDRYLFVLDRVRFEYMKRVGWLAGYPGEEFTLVELVVEFETLAPRLQSDIPSLSPDHPEYHRFNDMNSSEQEQFVRKLIPEALKGIENHSTTL